MCFQNETHLYTGNLLYGILEPLKKIDFQKGEVIFLLINTKGMKRGARVATNIKSAEIRR